jgi:8-oxo-dGTP diphosphatase
MLPRLRCMTSLYLTDEKGVLCLFRIGSRIADRMYIGTAGGHFEENELNDPLACVLREAREELDISAEDLEDLKLRYITVRLKNGEIRQNYYFFARLRRERPLESSEGILHWIPYEELKNLNMPVSAKHMILHYAQHGRFDENLYLSVTDTEDFDGVSFTALREF